MDNPKKEEILRACLHEFAEYGYEKANTNRISERAGVSKGLIFHYFGSKQQLFLLTVEKCINDLLACFEGVSFEGSSFIETTLAYGRIKAKFFAENPEHYRVISQAFLQTPKELQPELLQRYVKLRELGLSMMQDLLVKLELRPGVSRQRAMEIIAAVVRSLEDKYIPMLSQGKQLTADLMDWLTREYTELMELVMFGIAKR